MEKEKTPKDEMIDKLTGAIIEKGKEIQSSSKLEPLQQLEQVDVLLDTIHFLKDYDENVKVLNQYWLRENRRRKLEQSAKEGERY